MYHCRIRKLILKNKVRPAKYTLRSIAMPRAKPKVKSGSQVKDKARRRYPSTTAKQKSKEVCHKETEEE